MDYISEIEDDVNDLLARLRDKGIIAKAQYCIWDNGETKSVTIEIIEKVD